MRVLVDDFLIDAEDKSLLLLAAYPNVHIRIYNPKYTVGASILHRIVNVDNRQLANQLTQSIERDIRPENSWRTTANFSPDREVSRNKRLRLSFINLFPFDPILKPTHAII